MKYKIKINKKFLHLTGFLVILLFMSVKCNKHKESFIGPEYRLAASDFQILTAFTATHTPANFSNPTKDTVRFNATFSDRVTWFLALKGLTSGAKKNFTGLSKDLQSVKDLYWTGKSDDAIMFNSGEDVEATLSFMGSISTYKTTIHITTKRTYSHVIKLVNDFESATVGSFPSGGPPYWYTFFDGSDKVFDGVSNDKSILSADPRVPSGNKFYLLEGADGNKNYYIEGVGFDKQRQVPVSYPNPDSIYFNVYVYGFGIANTKFQIGFDEDDNNTNIWGDGPIKTSGEVTSDTEDEYDYGVIVDWTGWRLISFKYSDANSVPGLSPNGSQGNHIKEPLKVQKMGFVLLTTTTGGAAKVAFDYPVFTYGAPFDPNK